MGYYYKDFLGNAKPILDADKYAEVVPVVKGSKVKSKNAKKFRRDEEYGSARWGCPKDIAPFVDPKFENNIILTGTEFLTMNTRPKNPANARNLNVCVIGSSGSGSH